MKTTCGFFFQDYQHILEPGPLEAGAETGTYTRYCKLKVTVSLTIPGQKADVVEFTFLSQNS
jgi:hypothetical protein